MLLIREVFHCKPGKVRALVEKFQAMSKLSEKAGQGKFRLMTDLAGERYWTIVAEMEMPSLQAFDEMMQGKGMTEEMQQEFRAFWLRPTKPTVKMAYRELSKVARVRGDLSRQVQPRVIHRQQYAIDAE